MGGAHPWVSDSCEYVIEELLELLVEECRGVYGKLPQYQDSCYLLVLIPS